MGYLAALDGAGNAVDGAGGGCQVVGSGPDVGTDAAHSATRRQVLPRLRACTC